MANNSDGKVTNTSRKKTIRDALGIVVLVVPVCSGVSREARQKAIAWHGIWADRRPESRERRMRRIVSQIEDRSATVVPR